MKRVLSVYIAVSVILLISTANVYGLNGKLSKLPDFSITDSSGTGKTVFNPSETPYLKINIWGPIGKTPGGDLIAIKGWWKGLPSGSENPISQNDLGGLWPFSNWSWPATQNPGQYQAHLMGYTDRTFTVTPEPISSVLFIIGGGALAAIGYGRRKKKD